MKTRSLTVLLALAVLLPACGGGSSARRPVDAGAYSNLMHGRFYKAWAQPTSVTAHRGKISVPVDVAIDPRGRVTSFEIKRSSGDPAVDASITEVWRRVRRVKAPPTKAPFRLRIYFELDVR